MMMCIASLIMIAKKKKETSKISTIVNLLNGIYYNYIKDNHAVINNKVVK